MDFDINYFKSPRTREDIEYADKFNKEHQMYGSGGIPLSIYLIPPSKTREEKDKELLQKLGVESLLPKESDKTSENKGESGIINVPKLDINSEGILKDLGLEFKSPSNQVSNSEKKHPNAGQKTTGNNGYSMVVQDDGSYKYYNDSGEEVSEDTFRKTNPSMYSTSLTKNWTRGEDGRWRRGNKVLGDSPYNLLKEHGDPATYQKRDNDTYVNSKGHVISKRQYEDLVKAYDTYRNPIS